jgi:hypothetical protein
MKNKNKALRVNKSLEESCYRLRPNHMMTQSDLGDTSVELSC